MKTLPCSEERFLEDIKSHEMTVVRSDGADRFIRFKRPGSGTYHFDILTWPGKLIITSDMGTWVFSRLEDMFELFRMDKKDFEYQKEKTLQINPDYWAEKLCMGTHDCGTSAREWDQKVFKEKVMVLFNEHDFGDWLDEDVLKKKRNRKY